MPRMKFCAVLHLMHSPAAVGWSNEIVVATCDCACDCAWLFACMCGLHKPIHSTHTLANMRSHQQHSTSLTIDADAPLHHHTHSLSGIHSLTPTQPKAQGLPIPFMYPSPLTPRAVVRVGADGERLVPAGALLQSGGPQQPPGGPSVRAGDTHLVACRWWW